MSTDPEISALSSAAGLAEAGHAFARDKKWVEAIAAFERALTLDPEAGLVYGALGYCYEKAGRLAEAVEVYRRSAALLPDSLAVLFNLGNTLRLLDRMDEALAAYQGALKLDPRHVTSWNNLGLSLHGLGRHEEAIECYGRALEIRPEYAEAVNNLGSAYLAKNDVGSALEAYAAALLLDPGQTKVRFNEGVARLMAGDFEGGWAGYEFRTRPPWLDGLTGPAWDGEATLEGRTILLPYEQGFGDTVQFVRYAPLVAALGAEVHLQVQPSMKRLLSRVGGVASVVAAGEPLPQHDTHCTLMSLPHALGTTLSTVPAKVPYLCAPPELVAPWAERLSGARPVVGLAWSGNPGHHLDRNRSIPLESLMRALGNVSARFVSLQKEVRPADAAFMASLGSPSDFSAHLVDFADTAALLSQVDLVISVDTAVAHLAGALAKPVWILLPHAPDFRWMQGRQDSPWYPTASLFRQPRPGAWDPVLKSVREALSSWIGGFVAGGAPD